MGLNACIIVFLWVIFGLIWFAAIDADEIKGNLVMIAVSVMVMLPWLILLVGAVGMLALALWVTGIFSDKPKKT